MGPRMGISGRARWREWFAVSAAACLLLAGPSSAAEWGSRVAASVEALKSASAPAKGRVSTMALESQPGYLVLDVHQDPLGDPVNEATPGQPASMTPELVRSVMAVEEDDPATPEDERSVLLLGALTTPGQPTNLTDRATVALDTNGDLIDDFVTLSPAPQFEPEPSTFETPILRVTGSQQIDTGEWAVWLRTAEGYAAALDAWALGLTSVRFAMELVDPAGNYDWSPDDYVGELVSLPQPPAPARLPPPSAPSAPSACPTLPARVGRQLAVGWRHPGALPGLDHWPGVHPSRTTR